MGWKLVEVKQSNINQGKPISEELQLESEPDPTPNLDYILQLPLSELAKRDIAIQVFSEILGCEIWLCSNEEMATQVREDEPGAVIYTVDEVKRLIYLNPNPDDIRRIHATKLLFPGSSIIDSKLQEDSDE